MIWIGIVVGGIAGGWIGALLAHGNWFSLTSILISGIGSLAGVWAGYKIGKNYF